MSTAVQPLTTIGHVTPRVDAIERVTGQAKYTNDLKLPGMLYARVLRSPIRMPVFGTSIPARPRACPACRR
jgi:CO/xanthine dehydrogenase Mo-binding subunit